MKVLGVSGSPRRDSTTDRLVREVLRAAKGCETEFVSLAGRRIGPCIACLGCVKDNVCVLDDALRGLRRSIVEADAYVIGAANYFGMMNGMAHCFMERWYQFRHREGTAVAGKIGAAVGVGGGDPKPVLEDIRRFFEYNRIECVGTVAARGAASCFTCGYGETCRVGAIHMFFGPGTKITDDIIPSLEKQPEALQEARDVGRRLSERLHRFARAT